MSESFENQEIKPKLSNCLRKSKKGHSKGIAFDNMSPNDAVSLLKAYLQDLPIALIPLKAIPADQKFLDIYRSFPDASKDLLKKILQFISQKILPYADNNLMTAQNVTKAFSLVFFPPDIQLSELPCLQNFFHHLLEHSHEL
eukprot:TRINITY_DN36836_c0_g1_i1.p1 TRINITY_DN36836_c0_g1~~TRINITY_DN36836_c0_g1_i1.p1  ORF type:complete len:142 (-),score=15.10 TRINITY_DN36836_c0_g1_i1:66-491(-)